MILTQFYDNRIKGNHGQKVWVNLAQVSFAVSAKIPVIRTEEDTRRPFNELECETCTTIYLADRSIRVCETLEEIFG